MKELSPSVPDGKPDVVLKSKEASDSSFLTKFRYVLKVYLLECHSLIIIFIFNLEMQTETYGGQFWL